MAPDESGTWVRYGGRISWWEIPAYPAMGLLPLLGLLPLRDPWPLVILGATLLLCGLPLWLVLFDLFNPRAWVEGSRVQMPLILAGAIASMLSTWISVVYIVSGARPATWSEPLTRIDAIYVVVGNFVTAGSGDLVADSQIGRAMTAAIQLTSMLVLVLIVGRTVSVAAATRRAERLQWLKGRHPYPGDPEHEGD